MKVVTAREMREIDRIAIEEMGFPGTVLMGLAGKSVADYILDSFPSVKKVAVFSGAGNNGGDGFVAAYFLNNRGVATDIVIAGDLKKLSDSSKIYYNLCVNSGVPVKILDESGIESLSIDIYDLVIDALLGTGFNGTAEGLLSDLIAFINDGDVPVLSIDIPSGLESDGASPLGEAVMADYTVTIGLPKISLVTYPCKNFVGQLHISDIGFPRGLIESDEIRTELIDNEFIDRVHFHEIESAYSGIPDAHKGDRGHLFLVGGFYSMEGAIMMSARAALETGIGLATLLTTPESRNIIAGHIPELITASIDPPYDAMNILIDRFRSFFAVRSCDALVIGPGMGRDQSSENIFNVIIDNAFEYGVKRVLIDGDGLHHLATYIADGELDPRVVWIISPHMMEASRILKIDTHKVKADRYRWAKELANKTGAVTILKGPSTIVTDGDTALINTSGNPGLATGGSGDVLAGITGALLLRNFSGLDAAAAGAYIHGKSADICCSMRKEPLMKATDMIEYIGRAMNMPCRDTY